MVVERGCSWAVLMTRPLDVTTAPFAVVGGGAGLGPLEATVCVGGGGGRGGGRGCVCEK